MYRFAPFFVLLLSCTAVNAQEEPPVPLVGSVYVGVGHFTDQRLQLLLQQTHALAPGSMVLPATLPRLSRSNREPSGGLFSASIGLLPFRKAFRRGPELRLGVMATSELSLSAHYEHQTRVPYDTVVSVGSGEVFVMDSSFRQTYAIRHAYQLAGLHASLIWRTSTRFALYGGFGAGVGLIHGANTEVEYRESASLQKPGYWMVADPSLLAPTEQEYFNNGSGIWLQGSLPFGVDYQLHRTQEPWTRLRLYLEVIPTFIWADRPGLGSTYGSGLQQQFGLRISL